MVDKPVLQEIQELIKISWRNWWLMGVAWLHWYRAATSTDSIWLPSVTFDVVFYGSVLLGAAWQSSAPGNLIQSKNTSIASVVACFLPGSVATAFFCSLFAFLFMVILMLSGMHQTPKQYMRYPQGRLVNILDVPSGNQSRPEMGVPLSNSKI